MTEHVPKKQRYSQPLIEFFFAAGAILVVLGLLYSLARSWPSLDPLGLVMLVGIGLLLVVVCERLRLILREMQRITSLMRMTVKDPGAD